MDRMHMMTHQTEGFDNRPDFLKAVLKTLNEERIFVLKNKGMPNRKERLAALSERIATVKRKLKTA